MTPAIEELIRQIEAAGDVFAWYGPQPESTIAEVEAALGVIFPPSYRAFLGRYGGGGIRAMGGFSGIWNGDALRLNQGCLYGDTLRLRSDRGAPPYLVLVSAVHGSEEHFPPACLDTSRVDAAGECPVVCYSVLSRKVVPPEYANFAAFMEDELRADLEGALNEG